jgi:hypothetical protein
VFVLFHYTNSTPLLPVVSLAHLYQQNYKNSLYLDTRHIDSHAVQQENDMSTCPCPEVSCLLVTQDINKLMWKYEYKSIF